MSYSEIQKEFLADLINQPYNKQALGQFFYEQELYYRDKEHEYNVRTPRSTDEKTMLDYQADCFGSMAKAYGTAMAELENLVKGF